jgi:hypothetical protein
MLVAPKVPIDEEEVLVDIGVHCDVPHEVNLTRSFYEEKTGKKGGFGGKFYVYDAVSCFVPPPVIPYEPFLCDSVYSSDVKVSFTDYGYNLMKIITMPFGGGG